MLAVSLPDVVGRLVLLTVDSDEYVALINGIVARSYLV
jgi:hypothetical protein